MRPWLLEEVFLGVILCAGLSVLNSTHAGNVQFVNNVIYNTGLGSQIHPVRSRVTAEFVNNYYRQGPGSQRPFQPLIVGLGFGYEAFVKREFSAASKI